MAAATGNRAMRLGKKQVFLPQHMITFLRPKNNELPNFATFKVPLTFNKLDLRDYLLHAYGVPTLGVRSLIKQQAPRKSNIRRRIIRPKSIKIMTAELTKPFVWPERPTDKEPWNPETLEREAAQSARDEKWQRNVEKTSKIPLRDLEPRKAASASMRKEAKRLLKEGGWSNGMGAANKGDDVD